jgi:hypothetical protein
VIPVVMRSGNIIYQDDAFEPHIPVCAKLTLVSGFIHKICFFSLSTLRFSMACVQYTPLIILSSMTAGTTVVAYLIGLSTFSSIHCLGVEYGILGGVLLYVFFCQLSI